MDQRLFPRTGSLYQGTFRIFQKRTRRRVCLCIWEISVRRRNRRAFGSSALLQILSPFSSNHLSFPPGECRGWNLTCRLRCAVLQQPCIVTEIPQFILVIFNFYCKLTIIYRKTHAHTPKNIIVHHSERGSRSSVKHLVWIPIFILVKA